MTLRAEFSAIPSEFDAFLFAAVGDEENGAAVTVLSALARLDLDPWQEGARLAKLPKTVAARSLEPHLARLSLGNPERADIPAIASRLVELLPAPDVVLAGTKAASRASKKNTGPAIWLVWTACLLLGATALLGVLLPGPDYVQAPSVSSIRAPQ
jgi:hypothetical protein